MNTETLATIEPGLHRHVDLPTYLALPYMSGSRLNQLAKSPAHYRHSLTEERRTSDALERGTALHLAILEPALFGTRYVVAEPCAVLLKSGPRKDQPCGNAGLFQLRGIGWACGTHVKGGELEGGDAQVISAENDAAVRGMAAAIRAHDRARSLFEGRGEFEATVVFDDPDTGVRCRIRPDRLVERAGMLVELKSCRNAAEYAFARDAEARGYFLKLALYRRGLRAIGWPYRASAVLAVESAAPFDPVPYLITESDLDGADHEITRLLYRFRECERDDFWPGQASEFKELRRPRWAANDEEQ